MSVRMFRIKCVAVCWFKPYGLHSYCPVVIAHTLFPDINKYAFLTNSHLYFFLAYGLEKNIYIAIEFVVTKNSSAVCNQMVAVLRGPPVGCASASFPAPCSKIVVRQLLPQCWGVPLHGGMARYMLI